MAMDQSTPNAEDAADAGHPSGTALPAVATLLAETVRPADAENPEDAAYPRVNLRDPEAVWLPARHSRSRCRLLYWGSLVFANLQAKNEASLQPNRTLHWHSQEGAGSSNPYQGLKFNRSQKKLTVKTAGLYYVTLQLKLSPVLKNTDHKVQGRVSLALQLAPPIEGLDNSGLTVHLFPWSMEANLVEGSWSHLIPLQAGHCLSVKLSAYMDGAQEAYRDWQLSQTDITSFALFLVQPDTPQGLSATG
ncbi:tumor necrosis factor ligand superfamily member 9 isoform X2 [Mesocricetus auratus]|uniref:Tumor necrosis factor ligand superfamily member 9 isoform X2 n=1 Tax=Mesocricetus auratus TaxID=10036 RepID=A0A3Q0D9Q0_MESAU|nr:tumor necrosis factor ligand superfamily member 9 isoform X2 [Mesocricetus auratus]